MDAPVLAAPSGAVHGVPSLHVVTDDQVLARSDFPELASELLHRGRGRIALHLRGPRTSGAHLHSLALTLRDHRASVVVNDRVDVALVTGLRHVHLGARSLPPRVARAILGEGARLGVSTHSVSAVREAAQQGADWIFVGTIYPTPSHPGDPGRGVGAVKEATSVVPGVPVLAIGGVGPEHVGEVRSAGGHGVAVIRGVWSAADPLTALIEYLDELGTNPSEGSR